MPPLTLTILPESFTIHRLSPESTILDAVYRSRFFSTHPTTEQKIERLEALKGA